jgi:hypothetical protein
MVWIFDLKPVGRASSTIGALAMFRNQALTPKKAGVAKQVRADLALFEWLQMDAVDTPRQE